MLTEHHCLARKIGVSAFGAMQQPRRLKHRTKLTLDIIVDTRTDTAAPAPAPALPPAIETAVCAPLPHPAQLGHSSPGPPREACLPLTRRSSRAYRVLSSCTLSYCVFVGGQGFVRYSISLKWKRSSSFGCMASTCSLRISYTTRLGADKERKIEGDMIVGSIDP